MDKSQLAIGLEAIRRFIETGTEEVLTVFENEFPHDGAENGQLVLDKMDQILEDAEAKARMVVAEIAADLKSA